MTTKKLATVNEVINFFLMINVYLDIVPYSTGYKVSLANGCWFLVDKIESVPNAVLTYMAMNTKFSNEINLAYQN